MYHQNDVGATTFKVLANFSLLVALVIGRIVQQIFFGSLRPLEVEVSV